MDRNKGTLAVMLKRLQDGSEIWEIWELACGIVNKGSELAKMSFDQTEEAVKCHPDSDAINVCRGELLMKNGRYAEATDYFNRLSDRGERTATAAQLVWRRLINQGNQQDSEIVRGFLNEVAGRIDVQDKASCEFDCELVERLIY